MKPSCKVLIVAIVCSTLLLLYAVFPRSSRALRPLDDQSLITYSPATVAKAVKAAKAEKHHYTHFQFNHSVCFQKCHRKTEFSPSSKTRKQWWLLIEDNGHDIFKPIQWKSPEQKKRILEFLLQHAKDAGPDNEGIGVW